MTKTLVIDDFRNEYSFLSNFFPSPISLQLLGKFWTFPSGEALFHAGKIAVSDWSDEQKLSYVRKMSESASPKESKYLGRSISIDPQRWDGLSYRVMQRVQELKYAQNDLLREQLLATGNATLIEGNTWGDKLWGQVNGVGKNQLGIILMELRHKLAEGL